MRRQDKIIKMNRDQAKMDHLNLYISDRRYLINRIHSYQQFVRQLDNDPNSPSKRVLKYVIENYILPELQQELQVRIFLFIWNFDIFYRPIDFNSVQGARNGHSLHFKYFRRRAARKNHACITETLVMCFF